MFESPQDPLLPIGQFYRRLLKGVGSILLLVSLSLIIGTCGYKFMEGMNWVDAFFNAAMILSGMGPAKELQHTSTKIFASIYAIYSGLFLIAATGIMLVPVFHRLLHSFHRQKKSDI